MLKKQNFGIEIEFTGITRHQAAAVLAKYFGSQVVHEGGTYDTRKVADQKGRNWKVVYDSSIYSTNKDGSSAPDSRKCEVVSPILQYEDMELLQEVVRVLRKAGAVVNDSCGIHVHVDAANHDARSLKNLSYLMYAKEELILKAINANSGRVRHFCKPIDNEFFEKLKKAKNLDMDQLKELWYNGRVEQASKHYSHTRYRALNLHNVWYRGTVEFRMFNSTLHAGEVRAYVCLALALSAYAIEHERVSSMKYDKRGRWNECGVRFEATFKSMLNDLNIRVSNGEEFRNVREHLLKHLKAEDERLNAARVA